jgi:hypothetical protein
VVIILFYVLMVAATSGSLICPEMAVRVLSNIALDQNICSKDRPSVSRQQCVQSHIMFVGRPVPTTVIPLTSG